MSVEIKLAYADIPVYQEMFDEYVAWLESEACAQHHEEERNSLPGRYALPDGRLYLAWVDGKPAGCVALRRFDASRCEMKRLYVRPDFRGYGLAGRLVEQLLADALEIGYASMLLDTMDFMQGARILYKKMGFVEIPPYYFNPYESVVFFEKKLR